MEVFVACQHFIYFLRRPFNIQFINLVQHFFLFQYERETECSFLKSLVTQNFHSFEWLKILHTQFQNQSSLKKAGLYFPQDITSNMIGL